MSVFVKSSRDVLNGMLNKKYIRGLFVSLGLDGEAISFSDSYGKRSRPDGYIYWHKYAIDSQIGKVIDAIKKTGFDVELVRNLTEERHGILKILNDKK